MGRQKKPAIFFVASLLMCFSLTFVCAFLSHGANPQLDNGTESGLIPLNTAQPYAPCPDCQAFNDLNSKIRDGVISLSQARTRIADLLGGIKLSYFERGGKDYPPSKWVFPVEGRTPQAIGGRRDKGYVTGGYNYFDGNGHKGHPSFDIFIEDRNRDELDDGTGRPTRVLSMTGGIVVALESEWDSRSTLRGGKYIWIYDPGDGALVYYAHNKEILVSIGDLVEPGDPIATVGHSGLNAHKARSPTHLHLTFLKVRGGQLPPQNIYTILQDCRAAGPLLATRSGNGKTRRSVHSVRVQKQGKGNRKS